MSDKLLSNEFLSLIQEIYKDGKVSPQELVHLKQKVAEEKESVLRDFPESSQLATICASYESLVESTQDFILSLRNRKDGIDDDISSLGVAKVYGLLQAQNNLLQANLELFSSALQAKFR